MQTRELDRAATRVAKTTDMSDRATADKINRRLRIAKGENVRLVACLIPVWSLMLTCLSLTTNLARGAEEDHDRDVGREDSDKGIRGEIAALQAQVTSLQSTISGLQSQVKSLQNSNTSLQNQLTAARNVLALAPFVSVDPNVEIGVAGPHIKFKGANIHIESGSGATNDNGNPRGLGNLIIGYDEDPINYPTGGPGGGFLPLNPGDRGGSHNLVIGPGHRFTQGASGGLVAGEVNTINSIGSSITAGYANRTDGLFATVSGGEFNTASSQGSSVSGGGANTAAATDASVSGGLANTASGALSSVSSGAFNLASGQWASISGGESNTASGSTTSVTGGFQNTAVGVNTVIIGSQNITDNKNGSIAPQPPFP